MNSVLLGPNEVPPVHIPWGEINDITLKAIPAFLIERLTPFVCVCFIVFCLFGLLLFFIGYLPVFIEQT